MDVIMGDIYPTNPVDVLALDWPYRWFCPRLIQKSPRLPTCCPMLQCHGDRLCEGDESRPAPVSQTLDTCVCRRWPLWSLEASVWGYNPPPPPWSVTAVICRHWNLVGDQPTSVQYTLPLPECGHLCVGRDMEGSHGQNHPLGPPRPHQLGEGPLKAPS